MEKTKKFAIIFSVIGLILILTGVTYSFFNYTREGLANNFRVGNISFNSTQNGSINLTNVFPITSSELSTDVGNHDSVSISITGSTDYSKGVEYLVTFSDVNNTVNNKKIPVVFNVEETNIGTRSTDYYNERGSTNSVYLLNNDGDIKEGKHVLVGYIASGSTGINGSITITAYIDADKIAITDTYEPIHPDYVINPDMTSEEIGFCVSKLNNDGWTWDTGETAEAFCAGTGTSFGYTFQEMIDENWFSSSDYEYFLEHNILKPYITNNKTTSEWVNGRTVFTTSEWNNMSSLSFKIKVEANEGTWVEEESTPASCFTTNGKYGYNVNRTDQNVAACVSYLTNLWGEEEEGNNVDTGETYQSFCAGTGTDWGVTFDDAVRTNWFSSSDLESLLAINMVKITTVTITNYDTSCGLDVVIPKTINGGTVVEIGTPDGWNGFYNKGITSVKIPDTVTTINEGTLSDNRLTNVVMPNSVTTLGDNAFSNNKITSVTFSSNLHSISANAFATNELVELVIPEGVEMIGLDAFDNNKLVNVYLPSTIAYIMQDAFMRNPTLEGIHINKSCQQAKWMDFYPWVQLSEKDGLTIYGENDTVCDSW